MRKLMFVVPAAAIAMLGAGAFGLKAATLNSPPCWSESAASSRNAWRLNASGDGVYMRTTQNILKIEEVK